MISIYILKSDGLDMTHIDTLPFGDAEKERLTAINSSAHKRESLGGLVALQRLLQKLGDTSEKRIMRASNGKPYFDGECPLPFGISHSQGISAAALGDAESGDIGFDIEVVRDSTDTRAIAERFFSAEEKIEFQKNGETAEAFFSVWTAKEAYAKLDGSGLSAYLSNNGFIKNDAYLSRLRLDVSGQRLMLSVACRTEGQTIRIFTDTGEIK